MPFKYDLNITINYFNQYNCRPGIDQLSLSLISSKIIPKNIFAQELSKIKYQPQNKPFFLNSKIKLAKSLAQSLSSFSNILFIGITGSVASLYPQKNDDIDLFIITKSNTLWFTRFFLKLYLIYKQIPHRHHGDTKKSNSYCFNLWLDDTSLTIPPNRQNLRNAMDLILLIPLYNKNQIYQNFLANNSWVKKYLATGYYLLSKNNRISSKLILPNNSIITKSVNLVFFVTQFVFMFPKITTQSISLHFAFFHQN